MKQGIVSKIQRYSTKDGPGLRTTVFLMGCNLRCKWCANPETLKQTPQVYYFKERCQHCGLCVAHAQNHSITFDKEGCHIDRASCTNLMDMVDLCPFDAYELVGNTYTSEALVKRLLRDQTYYEMGEGGVTFSGGEAGLQWEFVLECMKKLKQHGIHTCLDTAGNLPWEHLEQLSEVSDLMLYDIKAFNKQIHQKCTGVSNDLILANIKRLASKQQAMRIRMIVVPGYNDDKEDVLDRLHLIHSFGSCVEQVDVLNYHIYGIGKYEKLGMTYPLNDVTAVTDDTLDWILEEGRKLGLKMTIGG